MATATFAERLNEAMKMRDLKQIDIVRRAQDSGVKMGKSHVSQYVGGKTIPRDANLSFLARTLDVDEAWLLGEDVPMSAADAQATASESPSAASTAAASNPAASAPEKASSAKATESSRTAAETSSTQQSSALTAATPAAPTPSQGNTATQTTPSQTTTNPTSEDRTMTEETETTQPTPPPAASSRSRISSTTCSMTCADRL